MELQPDRINELFMKTIGMDVENENSELPKSTEEETQVYDDRDVFIKERCEDELESGLTVRFCEEQETMKEKTDGDHSAEGEETSESQGQKPNRESLTCTQNDVEVLLNENEDTPKFCSEPDEENLSVKGGESDDGPDGGNKRIGKITSVLLKMEAVI